MTAMTATIPTKTGLILRSLRRDAAVVMGLLGLSIALLDGLDCPTVPGASRKRLAGISEFLARWAYELDVPDTGTRPRQRQWTPCATASSAPPKPSTPTAPPSRSEAPGCAPC
ncbi:hypothetical protein GCM10017771_92330 [Streptomyces capitiformicae]|uniref:Uncharacterized protein n=1 Tax=Streptomyces capitiformicae TaxID=2014920 RepID=A0A918ZSS8_9ACTN|nr:hypothetical protein GCM10017771_92330 [Streptomyces capitiformicae]